MIETAGARSPPRPRSPRAADFLSIGTNDLAHAVLGSDRFGGGAAPAHHPRVLARDRRDRRARPPRARVVLEVCGEAASEPASVPLLVGLGVDELSVGAARVGAGPRLGPLAAPRRGEPRRRALAPRRAPARPRPRRSASELLLGRSATQPASASSGDGRVVAVGPEA